MYIYHLNIFVFKGEFVVGGLNFQWILSMQRRGEEQSEAGGTCYFAK
jgi:hypothetical protein